MSVKEYVPELEVRTNKWGKDTGTPTGLWTTATGPTGLAGMSSGGRALCRPSCKKGVR